MRCCFSFSRSFYTFGMIDLNAYGEQHNSAGLLRAYREIFAREAARGSEVCFIERRSAFQAGIDKVNAQAAKALADGQFGAADYLSQFSVHYDGLHQRAAAGTDKLAPEKNEALEVALSFLAVQYGIRLVAYDQDDRLDLVYVNLLRQIPSGLAGDACWPALRLAADNMNVEAMARNYGASVEAAQAALDEAKGLIGTEAFWQKAADAVIDRLSPEYEAKSCDFILGAVGAAEKGFIIGGFAHFDLNNPGTLAIQLLPKVGQLHISNIDPESGSIEEVFCSLPPRPKPKRALPKKFEAD